MRKTVTIICLILTFFILYFLQVNFFTWFNIAGIMPNLFVIYILFIGLFIGKKMGAVFGILIGMYLDILIGNSIGITGIMLGIIGLLGEYFDKNFAKESRVIIMLMVIGATVLYEVGIYGFDVIKYNLTPEVWDFAYIVGIEVIYQAILVIILYPLMRNLGYKAEEIFKSKRILTRYF